MSIFLNLIFLQPAMCVRKLVTNFDINMLGATSRSVFFARELRRSKVCQDFAQGQRQRSLTVVPPPLPNACMLHQVHCLLWRQSRRDRTLAQFPTAVDASRMAVDHLVLVALLQIENAARMIASKMFDAIGLGNARIHRSSVCDENTGRL